MEGLAFPAELVAEIQALWAELEAGGEKVPDLPPPDALRALVETAFWASLLTEEGRTLRFALCCTPGDAVVRRGGREDPVESWPLKGDRPFDVAELRRLAVAAPDAAIWVQFCGPEDAPRIRGLLNLGLSWQIARMGLSDAAEPLPDAFFLHIDGPGVVTVVLHQVPVLGLYNGAVRRPRSVIRPFGGKPFYEDAVRDLMGRLRLPEVYAADAAFPVMRRTYFRVVRTIVNGIRDRGHGGALVLAPPRSRALDPMAAMIRARYPVEDEGGLLAGHMLASVEARLAFEATSGQDEALALRAASMRVVEAATFVAGLAGTDGAIIMRTDMALVGFGAEIAVDPKVPAPVIELGEEGPEGPREVRAERFGMRHRSALWLCAKAPDVSAFVVSQDGGVSFVFGQEGQVYLVPDLETLQFAAEAVFGGT